MPRILILEPGKNPQPYRFGLDAGTVYIGRATGNDIVLTCGSISGRHASMERVPGGFRLIDHDSTNGVTRGGAPVKQADLANGDALKLGDVGFEFQLSEEEMATLAAELPPKDATDETPKRKPEASAADEDPVPLVRIPFRISFFQVAVLLVLAGLAFCFGMATRHKNDFGIPLWVAILRGHPAPEKAEDKTNPVQNESPAPEGVPEELEGWEQRDREGEENAEQ